MQCRPPITPSLTRYVSPAESHLYGVGVAKHIVLPTLWLVNEYPAATLNFCRFKWTY